MRRARAYTARVRSLVAAALAVAGTAVGAEPGPLPARERAVPVLVGDHLRCDGSATEGHPLQYRWSVTPPDGVTVELPEEDPVLDLLVNATGLWSVELVALYAHESDKPGLLYTATTKVTLSATMPEPPTAAFEWSPPEPAVMEPVGFSFTGSCEGACIYRWTFGDGAAAAAGDPDHAFTHRGSFPVSLSVTNPAGSDTVGATVVVHDCAVVPEPTRDGSCAGGDVLLEVPPPAGEAFLWSTGAETRSVVVGLPGRYWVSVDVGDSCWGTAETVVELDNCGDPGGDANLDGHLDAADAAALITELGDEDGERVPDAGGGDRLAPGGDVTGDGMLRRDDLAAVVHLLLKSCPTP